MTTICQACHTEMPDKYINALIPYLADLSEGGDVKWWLCENCEGWLDMCVKTMRQLNDFLCPQCGHTLYEHYADQGCMTCNECDALCPNTTQEGDAE